MKAIFYTTLFIALILNSCSGNRELVKYHEFTLAKTKLMTNTKEMIRHDGIYFQNYVNTQNADSSEWNRIAIRIFFKDGTFVNISKGRSSVQIKAEPCVGLSEEDRDFILAWGIYRIINDTIIIQKIHPHRGLFEKFGKEDLKAIVNSDSSITFIEKVLPNGRRLNTYEIYDFMKCDHMPTSENTFTTNLYQKLSDK